MSLAGTVTIAMGLFSIFSFALLIALWDFHPPAQRDIVEIREKLLRMDEFLAAVQGQRDEELPELVVELGPGQRLAA